MAPKAADKLTDAEKKKVKQANKAKANPGKSEEKANKNLKRRIARGQVVDPTAADKKTAAVGDDESSGAAPTIAKTKQTDSEKAEKRKLKMLAIEQEFQEKQRQEQKDRFAKMVSSENAENTP